MAKVISVKKVKNSYSLDKFRERRKFTKVYDIEVEDNHNYVANNLLVSNSAAITYRDVNLSQLKDVYFRIGVTATPFRNDGADLALESVLSDIVYEYTVPTAIKEGFLVQPEFRLIDNKINKNNPNYQTQYREGIVENDDRNKIIAAVAKEHRNDSTIILVQQIPHGNTLKSLIPGAEFINGEEKDSVRIRLMEDFRKGKLKTLIGTSVIGEGVDLPIGKVLIMAGGGKAESQIIQNVGRVLRIFPGKTEAIVYDFDDLGASHLEEHAKARQAIYDQYDL